jgi:hypothetical protein
VIEDCNYLPSICELSNVFDPDREFRRRRKIQALLDEQRRAKVENEEKKESLELFTGPDGRRYALRPGSCGRVKEYLDEGPRVFSSGGGGSDS